MYKMVGPLNNHVYLRMRRGGAAPWVIFHANPWNAESLPYLVYVNHADALKGQSQPRVDHRGVEMLLPIVWGGQFLREGEMEEREQIYQLIIGIINVLSMLIMIGDAAKV